MMGGRIQPVALPLPLPLPLLLPPLTPILGVEESVAREFVLVDATAVLEIFEG
jgi:hypothetical protein